MQASRNRPEYPSINNFQQNLVAILRRRSQFDLIHLVKKNSNLTSTHLRMPYISFGLYLFACTSLRVYFAFIFLRVSIYVHLSLYVYLFTHIFFTCPYLRAYACIFWVYLLCVSLYVHQSVCIFSFIPSRFGSLHMCIFSKHFSSVSLCVYILCASFRLQSSTTPCNDFLDG